MRSMLLAVVVIATAAPPVHADDEATTIEAQVTDARAATTEATDAAPLLTSVPTDEPLVTTTIAQASDDVAGGDATTEPAAAAAGEPGRPAEKGTLGLGLIFGEPTGITAKLYLADDRAIQGAIGGSFYADAWQLHGEYVLHPWILQDRDTFVLPVYVGPGARFMYYNEGRDGDAHVAIGLRGVIGLLFDFKNVPLDVFVEAGAVLEYDFDNGFGPGLNVGAGIRYYF